MKKETIQRWLPVKLTGSELLDKGREVSELVRERTLIDAERSASARTYQNKIKQLDGQIAKVSETISNQTEERPVTCIAEWSQEKDLFLVRRCDTGEIIESRPLQRHEKQHEIQFPDEEEAREQAPHPAQMELSEAFDQAVDPGEDPGFPTKADDGDVPLEGPIED